MEQYKQEFKPIISVAMVVYNHEKYLDHALQSIFEQKISVPFEVVIGEDCSQDSSREIIDQWKNRYPEIIKPLYREHNIGMVKNVNEVIFSCQGEYVAWLEGDDYWTDKEKLQKQLFFLQNHREAYIGVLHNAQVVDADERPCPQHQNNYPIRKEQDFVWKDFQKGYMPGQTATFFYRNIFTDMDEQEKALFWNCHANGDSSIICVLLLYGKLKIMPDVMSAYRLVASGASNWHSIAAGKNYSLVYYQKILDLEKLSESLLGRKKELNGWRYRSFASALLQAYKDPTPKNKEILENIWSMENHKLGACLYCGKLALKHIFAPTS